MAKKHQKFVPDASESDSDAPETVQTTAAKVGALEKERAVKEFHASTALKRKEANKAREQARKSAAEDRRRKVASSSTLPRSSPPAPSSPGEDGEPDTAKVDDMDLDPESLRLQRRMEKAMQEADDEDEEEPAEEDGAASGSGSNSSDEGLSASESESDSDDGPELEKSSVQPPPKFAAPKSPKRTTATSNTPSIPSRSPFLLSKSLPPSTLLSEDIFDRARAAIDAQEAKQAAREERKKAKLGTKKKKRNAKTKSSLSLSRSSAKDVVIGSTVVRALAPTTKKTPAPETNSHKQFIRTSRSKKKGRYERRPVNLTLSAGIPGPALGFARGR